MASWYNSTLFPSPHSSWHHEQCDGSRTLTKATENGCPIQRTHYSLLSENKTSIPQNFVYAVRWCTFICTRHKYIIPLHRTPCTHYLGFFVPSHLEQLSQTIKYNVTISRQWFTKFRRVLKIQAPYNSGSEPETAPGGIAPRPLSLVATTLLIETVPPTFIQLLL